MYSMKGGREIGDIGVEGVRWRQPTSIWFDTKNSALSIKKKQTSYFIPFDSAIKGADETTNQRKNIARTSLLSDLQAIHFIRRDKSVYDRCRKNSRGVSDRDRDRIVRRKWGANVFRVLGRGEERMERAVRECRETEIEGHTRSLRPSSIRIPRISVNGPLLPRPFG